MNNNETYIARIPQNGFGLQTSGTCIKLSYNMLAEQAVKDGHINEDEVLSQVNVLEDGIELVVKSLSRGGNDNG